MGLLDDALGFVFGDDGEQGVVDTRADRTKEGKRWWEKWEAVFGEGGPADPLKIYQAAMNALNTPAINVQLDGVNIPALPRAGLTKAQALLGVLDPWYQGGYLLEQGRKGMGYSQPASGGLVGNVLNSASNSFGNTVGRGVAGGLGGIFGQTSLSNVPMSSANPNLNQYTRFNYWS